MTYISVSEFARRTGMARETVTLHIRKGLLPAQVMFADRKRLTYRIHTEHVEPNRQRNQRSRNRFEVSELILDIKNKHGLTNAAIGRIVGMSTPSIERYLLQRHTASQETIDKLEHLLDLDDLD